MTKLNALAAAAVIAALSTTLAHAQSGTFRQSTTSGLVRGCKTSTRLPRVASGRSARKR